MLEQRTRPIAGANERRMHAFDDANCSQSPPAFIDVLLAYRFALLDHYLWRLPRMSILMHMHVE